MSDIQIKMHRWSKWSGPPNHHLWGRVVVGRWLGGLVPLGDHHHLPDHLTTFSRPITRINIARPPGCCPRSAAGAHRNVDDEPFSGGDHVGLANLENTWISTARAEPQVKKEFNR